MIGAGTRFVSVLLILTYLDVASAQWRDDLSSMLSAGISEGAAIGLYVGRLRYDSPSSGEALVYSTTSEFFDVQPTTGDVTLKKKLVYRTDQNISVVFTAKVSNREEHRTVVMKVLPINHPPFFDQSSYRTSFKSGAAVGSMVYNSILVSDADDGPNGTLVVKCNSGANSEVCQFFNVASAVEPGQGGTLRVSVFVAKALNVSVQSHSIPILATDFGSPPLNATVTLRLDLESSVDSRPVFLTSPIILTINELDANLDKDLFVVRVKDAREASAGNSIDFEKQDDSKNWFRLGTPTISSDGIYNVAIKSAQSIRLIDNNKNQRYIFYIKATQVFNGQKTQVFSEVQVIVNIMDVNDNAPTFSQNAYSANVTEGLTNGATISGLSIFVSDDDLGDNAYFELSMESRPSPSPNIFGLVPTFGQGSAAIAVIVNKPEFLRYSSNLPKEYTLLVTAKETKTVEKRSSSATVLIRVISTTNHPPYFPFVLNPIVVPDDMKVGEVISNFIRAQDDDSGDYGILTYSLSNDGNANTYFSIDPATGVLTLKSPLNSTIQSKYLFSVIATDKGGMSASTGIRINVVDSKKQGPVFSLPFYVTNVTELQTSLFPPVTIQATMEPMRNDRVFKYELSRTLSPPIADLFKVNPTSGVFTMVKGVDYNQTPNKQGYFDVDVVASVVGYDEIPKSNVTVRVYVLDTNNHAPYFTPINMTYSKTIKDITPPLTELFHLNASDDDVGINAQVNYLIQSGAQDNFIVDYFSGILSVARNPRLRPNTTYNITVIAVDGGQPQLTGTTMVYITVTDSVSKPPEFSFNEYTFYVTEGSTRGLLVGSARATSPDQRAVINYSFWSTTWKAYNLAGNEVIANVADWFTVDSLTADIKVEGNIVYATAVKITVLLRARVLNPDPEVTGDVSKNVSVTFLILPKGDNPDVVKFSPSTDFMFIQVYEKQPVNTVVFRFNAFYLKTFEPITDYSFFNQTKDGDCFTLERSTGVLKVQRLCNYVEVNPTKNVTYYLVAKAPNPSIAQAGATVVVNVLPLTFTPVFNQSVYSFKVMSNDPSGKFVGQVYAERPPSITSKVFYSLDIPSEIFQIDPQSGAIILLRRLDELNTKQLFYTLLVTAQITNGSSVYSSKSTVNIEVIPVRVFPPRFSGAPYSFTVSTTTNGSIGQVSAYDPDPFNPTTIKYAIVGTSPATDAFSVDTNSGMINLNKNISGSPSIILNISATDSSDKPLTSYAQATINVINISPDKPTFLTPPTTSYPIYYGETYNNITQFFGVAPKGRTLQYFLDTTLLSNDMKQKFNLNPTTGVLSVNGKLDGVVSTTNKLIIVLSDGISNVTQGISVDVYSQNPPTFNCKTNPMNVTALDYSKDGDPLEPSLKIETGSTCSYNKPDTNFFYKILSINTTDPAGDNLLRIDQSTGQLLANTFLNAYKLQGTSLRVLVASNESDSAQAQNRPGTVITCNLQFKGRNIRPPSFSISNPYCPGSGASISKGIMDLSTFNTPVLKVTAGDCDMPGFRDLIYGIFAITFNNYVGSSVTDYQNDLQQKSSASAFRIDPSSGQVYTNLNDMRLFYTGWFDVQINATTAGNPTLYDRSQLKVFVLRGNQVMRAIFRRSAPVAQNESIDFVKLVNNQTSPKYQMIPDVVTTYVDSSGARNTSYSSMCYFLLKLEDAVGYSIVTDLDDVKRIINASRLASDFGLLNLYDTCYSRQTTKWWSDKWFLWYILIAFSILVFVVALVLTCCVCLYWPMNLKEISNSRPYVVLDDPQMLTAGSVAGDRW